MAFDREYFLGRLQDLESSSVSGQLDPDGLASLCLELFQDVAPLIDVAAIEQKLVDHGTADVGALRSALSLVRGWCLRPLPVGERVIEPDVVAAELQEFFDTLATYQSRFPAIEILLRIELFGNPRFHELVACRDDAEDDYSGLVEAVRGKVELIPDEELPDVLQKLRDETESEDDQSFRINVPDGLLSPNFFDERPAETIRQRVAEYVASIRPRSLRAMFKSGEVRYPSSPIGLARLLALRVTSSELREAERVVATAVACLVERMTEVRRREAAKTLGVCVEGRLLAGVDRDPLGASAIKSGRVDPAYEFRKLVRAAAKLSAREEVTPMKKMQVVLFSASPLDESRLRLEEEAREIEDKVRAAAHRDLVSIRSRTAARPQDLLQVLNEEAAVVVHFSGHGAGSEGIVLEDRNGDGQMVSGDALRQLFSAVGDEVKLVFLNACHSENQAQAIKDQVGCVVAMRSEIDDQTAIQFAAAFYRAIAFGKDVGNAFEQGMAAIALESLPDSAAPVLLTRGDVDASTLVLVNP